ncbi:uncharacterized protein RJT21DRAFT_133606 [Scheffersomyces amazonensis]|uniref:uncharacterized protein n=1 Tax=Scheffersomyces amazonensis TaxID=1078765 RepID=UPI00315DD2E7
MESQSQVEQELQSTSIVSETGDDQVSSIASETIEHTTSTATPATTNNIPTVNGKQSTSTPTPNPVSNPVASAIPPSKRFKTESPREGSVDPEGAFTATDRPPIHEIVGGSSVRQYLNKHLTAHLLEGLRHIGKEKPEDPLRVLGEFLIARAGELEQQQQEQQQE